MNLEEVEAASKNFLVFEALRTNIFILRGIAWSKWGSIASINSAGTGLELRNLRCHPRDGSWDLSEPTVTPQLTTNLDGGPLKHISWSPTGSELAVVDSAGRVTILQIFSSLNKPTLARPCNTDSADDLHAVVGSFWLNLAPVQNRMVRLFINVILHRPNLLW
jgi:mediator of RNA polymerase II transcription subunit 16